MSQVFKNQNVSFWPEPNYTIFPKLRLFQGFYPKMCFSYATSISYEIWLLGNYKLQTQPRKSWNFHTDYWISSLWPPYCTVSPNIHPTWVTFAGLNYLVRHLLTSETNTLHAVTCHLSLKKKKQRTLLVPHTIWQKNSSHKTAKVLTTFVFIWKVWHTCWWIGFYSFIFN